MWVCYSWVLSSSVTTRLLGRRCFISLESRQPSESQGGQQCLHTLGWGHVSSAGTGRGWLGSGHPHLLWVSEASTSRLPVETAFPMAACQTAPQPIATTTLCESKQLQKWQEKVSDLIRGRRPRPLATASSQPHSCSVFWYLASSRSQ